MGHAYFSTLNTSVQDHKILISLVTTTLSARGCSKRVFCHHRRLLWHMQRVATIPNPNFAQDSPAVLKLELQPGLVAGQRRNRIGRQSQSGRSVVMVRQCQDVIVIHAKPILTRWKCRVSRVELKRDVCLDVLGIAGSSK